MTESDHQNIGTTRAQSVNYHLARAACSLALLTVVGCGLELTDGTLFGLAVDSENDQARPAAADMVTVRFRNFAVSEAVDVQFYASVESLARLPDDLLVPENLVTASIGIAGTGIVQPQREDAIEYPCSAQLTFGTAGGRFSDNESGEPRGSGTPRWVQEGPLALCGTTVTFVFAGNGTEFTTAVTVNR